MHPEDARGLGLSDGTLVVCESTRGAVRVQVQLSGAMRRGTVALPHGYGLDYPEGDARRAWGASVNELTDARHRDPLTGTPFHKHVRVRIRAA